MASLSNKHPHQQIDCLTIKDDKIIMTKDQILGAWSQYVKDLDNDSNEE